MLVRKGHFADSYLGMKLHTEKSGVKHHEMGVIFWGIKYGLSANFGIDSVSASRRIEGFVLNFDISLERLFIGFTERGFFMKAKWGLQHRCVGRRQDKWLFFCLQIKLLYSVTSQL